MKDSVVRIAVPIYQVRLWVSVSSDLEAARTRMRKRFGGVPGRLADMDALCSSYGTDMGLFFKRGYISASVVAHEVFHLTQHIVELVGGTLGKSDLESEALLHEWLTVRVHRALIAAGERKALEDSLGKDARPL